MAIDPTARETNIRDSITKFLIDNLDAADLKIFFDTMYVDYPEKVATELKKWYVVDFRSLDIGPLAECSFNIFMFARADREGFKVSQMRDNFVDLLIDDTMTDGMARIDLYASHPTNPWTLLGGMVPFIDFESAHDVLADGTKFKWLTITLRWGSK